jgi:NAD(P)-dependent dehydrogenase (short-subunit alcohol dehydrogenase family)
MKHELRVMQAQGSGSIVNLSSTMGHRGAPGASLYTASKHAVEGLTKSAALEGAAFGVRVNAVAPGPIETAMLDRFIGNSDRKAGLVASVPLKRAGRPEEIADAMYSSLQLRPRSSPARSSPSMAEGPHRDGRPGAPIR